MAYSKETHELLNRGYRYALSLTSNADDAFDLVQGAYLKIREKNKPLVIPYLIATIRNQFIDQLRKLKLHKQWKAAQQDQESIEEGNSVEPVLEKSLALLPVRNREILFLSVVEEFTAQEIADLLEIPRGTVLSTLSRTKEKLRNDLKEKSILDL